MSIPSITTQITTSNVIQRVDSQTEPVLTTVLTFFGILVIGFILTRIAQLFVKRIIKREYFDPKFKRLSSLTISAKKVVVNTVGGIGYVITPLFALRYVGILQTVGIWVGVVVLFVVMWGSTLFLWDYVTNFIAKRRILVSEGDSISVGYVEGTVLSCKSYYILVKTREGHTLHVPYRYIDMYA